MSALLDDIQQDLTGEADGLAKLEKARAALDQLPLGSEDWITFKTAIANIYGRLPSRHRAEYLDRSIATYQEVLKYRRREKDASAWARTQHNLGTTWRDRKSGDISDNYEKALDCYVKAQSAYQFKRDRLEWGAVHSSIGNVYSVRRKGDPHDNYKKAIKHLGLALRAFTLKFDARQHARTKANLARLYFYSPIGRKATNYERAIKNAREGLAAIADMPGNFDHVNLHLVIASSYRRLPSMKGVRRFEKAIEHYRLVEKILDRSQQPEAWARLAFNWALAERENPRKDTRANMARARELLIASLEIWTPKKFPDLWINAQQALCNTQAKTEEWPQVIRIADEVIVEARRRLSSIDNLYERRRLLASIGPVKNLKVLALARTKGAVAALTALREHRAELLGRPDSTTEPDQPAEEIKIPADAAMVYFCVLPLEDEPTLVFMLTNIGGKTRREMFNLPKLSNRNLEKLFETNPANPDLAWMAGYERFKAKNDLKDFMSAIDFVTRELSARLQPLLERLVALPSNVVKLHISSSGALSVLPFSALLTGGNANEVIVDRFAVTHETGLPIEASSADEPTELTELLTIVDPRNNLRFARMEAEAVSGHFAVAHHRPGSEATKANVSQAISELGANAYLHFICHGQYAQRQPEMSHMEMANDETFSLAEIAQLLRLPRGCSVVLSACETGINEFKELPEESYGLPMAFLAAGASSVLSPLWPVSDFMTAKLMSLYYKATNSGLERSQALREAQLALRKKTAGEEDVAKAISQIRWGQQSPVEGTIECSQIDLKHPFFWAGFILIE